MSNASITTVGELPSSPLQGSFISRSRSSTKLVDDVTSLTSFNPFSEEDENEQSSLTLVSSLFSRMKNTLTAPLSATTTSASSNTNGAGTSTGAGAGATSSVLGGGVDARRPSMTATQTSQSNSSSTGRSTGAGIGTDRPSPLSIVPPAKPAPPSVSLTPVISEVPTFSIDYSEGSPNAVGIGGISSRPFTPVYDQGENGFFGSSIPGFPIQDDARSIRTVASVNRSASVSKVMRRIRGEGLSRDYWMDDESCKECTDCQSVFTTWRRKHHCRICGQIFCSRCASNIIEGSRFGHNGMVRVCNICLEKLGKADEDDEDDRRSVTSSLISFPANQLGSDAVTTMHLGRHPQSSFAAAQLFGRGDEPFNLYSIAETRRVSGSFDHNLSNLRAESPGGIDSDEAAGYLPARDAPAPFRRNLATDDDKVQVTPAFIGQITSPAHALAPGSKTPIEFPVTVPVNVTPTMSTITFPVSSPDQFGLDSPRPHSAMRSRYNSFGADFDLGTTPHMRSRAQSRQDDFPTMQAGWRTRRESTAYAQELNMTSMSHLRIMLHQMLTKEDIPNVKEWQDTLLRLAMSISQKLTFTAHPHRQGEDMDVRRYVKIKKIPGGRPSDSEYIDGAVITKNVAHKDMTRLQRNPRVMFITFPLEFSRVQGQYLHFKQIVMQEKEYLRNLSARIASLRPHVILVEKSVSRIALEELAKHHIVVARAVKPSAIKFVSRMTQGSVTTSIDKLVTSETRLGYCTKFRLQTFDHPLIPGRRKTYMRFEGCSPEMGCTLILRGADIVTLRKIKRVTRFLSFIVRNLKLETHLWKDLVITVHSLNSEAVPASLSDQCRTPSAGTLLLSEATIVDSPQNQGTSLLEVDEISSDSAKQNGRHSPHIENEEDLPDEDAEQLRLTKRIHQSLEPYTKTFISVSATLRFPPPYPIRTMKKLDDELIAAKHDWEDEVIRREERSHSKQQPQELDSEATPLIQIGSSEFLDQESINARIEALPSPDIPKTPTMTSTPLAIGPISVPTSRPDSMGYFDIKPAESRTLIQVDNGILSVASALASPSVLPPEPMMKLKTVDDIQLESRLSYIRLKHEEQRRIWEWYLRKNPDDFVLEKYQSISIWRYIALTTEIDTRRACFAPQMHYVDFYGDNDWTLGQFIETAVTETISYMQDPKNVCSGKGCGQPLARHCQVYVHNETRVFVAVESEDVEIVGSHPPMGDLITTWSTCRLCRTRTPFITVSEEMLRYSFAKFLELHFYPADVHLLHHSAGCQHNIYQHHVRYFAYRSMMVCFQADPVAIHEIVYPAMRIRIRPETQLEMKNTDYTLLQSKNTTWYALVIEEAKFLLSREDDPSSPTAEHLKGLIARAENERVEIAGLIDRVYNESAMTDTLALNEVRTSRQDKIVAWGKDLEAMKARIYQLEYQAIDRPNRRVSTFGSVRAIWPKKHDVSTSLNVASSSVSEAEESLPPKRQTSTESVASSASSASETDAGPEKETQSEAETSIELPHLPPANNADITNSYLASQNAASETASTESHPEPLRLALEEAGASVERIQPEFELILSPAEKSDPDSDSTIAAARKEEAQSNLEPIPATQEDEEMRMRRPARLPKTRLPKRSAQQPSVAELVKKYSDILPAEGVRDLAKTALAPPMPISESEAEYSAPLARNQTRTNRSRHHQLSHNQQTSDIDQGYAASVNPRHSSARTRRIASTAAQGSRIPGPGVSAQPSQLNPHQFVPPSSPTPSGRFPAAFNAPTSNNNRPGKGKSNYRIPSRGEKTARLTQTAGPKSTFRRPSGIPGGKVSNIAKQFERLNKDNERANRRYSVLHGRRARPVASARTKVEILDSVKDAIRDESDSDDPSSEADDEGEGEEETNKNEKPSASASLESSFEGPSNLPNPLPEQKPPEETSPSTNERPSESKGPETAQVVQVDKREDSSSVPPTPSIPSSERESTSTSQILEVETGSGTERNSILKALTGFWHPPPRQRLDLEHDDAGGDPEHLFRDSSIAVRTDEPTSIIAMALRSKSYSDLLAKSRAEKRLVREVKLTDSGEAFMPDDDRSTMETQSTWGVVNMDGTDSSNPTDELRMPSSKAPWAITLETNDLAISCTILYPEQFDALRRNYDCEKSIVESLARCLKWDASGGKSGSAFLKTRDDRFIAKELSKPELQTMETFAPAYFDYMSSAISENRPTLLAKVFGIYKITWRKIKKDGAKLKTMQMSLIVMENLFYDRRFSKIYDLKGSTRNRHVQSTGRENEVLLDENLVETAHLAPFYLREHSKRILRWLLYIDSRFLANINVMDYSLVVGVDNTTNELVIGIVDYVRTYTWDKKLESWVKESTFLGGVGKGEPTILSPVQYRQRFISAMERYFPLIPDRWMKQKDAPEEDTNTLAELWKDW